MSKITYQRIRLLNVKQSQALIIILTLALFIMIIKVVINIFSIDPSFTIL